MGRRKIEIRAIKDDRNRSVTFLKRKGGLFKKAHELSVLCSVDVAVIIFGHNKKLYEFSSGDINETLRKYQYYGPPHEHKGPADFKNKSGGGSDDDEDEEEEPQMPHDDGMPPHHAMPQPIHLNSFQHLRAPGQSASPPMPNGMFQPPPRTGTPSQSQMGSRPSSRNTIRRPSSNLVPMQHPPHATPPPPPQNGFAYTPNPPIYHPQAPPQPSPQPPQYAQFQQQQSITPQPQHQQLPQQPPPPAQQQSYAHESSHQHPPPQQQQPQPQPQPQQQQQQQQSSHQHPHFNYG